MVSQDSTNLVGNTVAPGFSSLQRTLANAEAEYQTHPLLNGVTLEKDELMVGAAMCRVPATTRSWERTMTAIQLRNKPNTTSGTLAHSAWTTRFLLCPRSRIS